MHKRQDQREERTVKSIPPIAMPLARVMARLWVVAACRCGPQEFYASIFLVRETLSGALGETMKYRTIERVPTLGNICGCMQ